MVIVSTKLSTFHTLSDAGRLVHFASQRGLTVGAVMNFRPHVQSLGLLISFTGYPVYQMHNECNGSEN